MKTKLANMEGKIFPTNEYGDLEILDYQNSRHVLVRFLDTNYQKVVRMDAIYNGEVRDYLKPSICGVGIIGDKYPVAVGRVHVREYTIWAGMIHRCYNPLCLARDPTYVGCGVSTNFAYYPYFYEWCHNQIGFNNLGWHMDKDLLFKGNKLYSEDTCVFLPAQINVALTNNTSNRGSYPVGVSFEKNKYRARWQQNGRTFNAGSFDNEMDAFLAYKLHREQYLITLAYQYEPLLDPRAFEALLHYQVDISD